MSNVPAFLSVILLKDSQMYNNTGQRDHNATCREPEMWNVAMICAKSSHHFCHVLKYKWPLLQRPSLCDSGVCIRSSLPALLPTLIEEELELVGHFTSKSGVRLLLSIASDCNLIRTVCSYSGTYSLEGSQMDKDKDAGRTESETNEETPVEGEQDTLTKEITEDQPKTEDVHTTVMIAVSQSSKGYPNPSISSRHAFEWVSKNLIKPCCAKQYKLLILHVQVIDEDGLEELDSVYASPSDFEHSRHKERVKGRALIQTFVKQCHDAQIECEGWIKKGDPKDVICQEVKRKNPDLLVLGCRGLGTLQSATSLSEVKLGTIDWQVRGDNHLAVSLKNRRLDSLHIFPFVWWRLSLRMFVAGVSSYVSKHVDCPVIVIKRDPKDVPDDPMDD